MDETKMAEAKCHFTPEKQENSKPGVRKIRGCCPTTRKKGPGGFMNILCNVLGCCGLLSACYDPPTPH
ncbi:hypothetical protein V6N13_116191 [Hibiscus sabdariffa]|uniref:Uncharacterized protein n=2 Tax=Hibiscus sabdariffa TaxID=183260 RepID=A0ABR2PBV8_9ROSI